MSKPNALQTALGKQVSRRKKQCPNSLLTHMRRMVRSSLFTQTKRATARRTDLVRFSGDGQLHCNTKEMALYKTAAKERNDKEHVAINQKRTPIQKRSRVKMLKRPWRH
ncbi:hypothetical protein PoB_001580600 [Plakobranchus ocellatus]|uniref:Uncharacterized protein n=1 Tax=Plakobranchus ocellatus TaxID=259542 RepID=A0AAV3YQ72_9GAST|nr:hypothetical protein PoB_001580600 [Plakobranchus ocellatus]